MSAYILSKFDRILSLVAKTLDQSKISSHEIDNVVLIGGFNDVPKLRSMLEAFFNGKVLTKGIEPDEVVVTGAAIQVHGSSSISSCPSLKAQ